MLCYNYANINEVMMKKILLIALCLGFGLTQSIQTKQVEVAITDWNSINLYESLDETIGGG